MLCQKHLLKWAYYFRLHEIYTSHGIIPQKNHPDTPVT